MRRTPLRRWGKKGPWLPRWKKKERERLRQQGWVKSGRKANQPSAKARAWNGGQKEKCAASMLGKCSGDIHTEHIFNRGIRFVNGCDCKVNRIHLCFTHHIPGKHTQGRETFYGQHADLQELLEAAREHRRLRLLPGSLMPCAPKCTRRP